MWSHRNGHDTWSKATYETLKTLTRTQQNRTSVIEDKKGELLTDDEAVLNRWTEYCQELYNFPLQPDKSILVDEPKHNIPEPLPVMKEEVKEAVKSLQGGKSPGLDNIPSELLKQGGEAVTEVLTTLCQKIWETKQWPTEWTQSLIIPIPKKGDTRKCQNHRTISLISHPSKVMLKVIQNRLKKEAEELLAEEQAGFRANRSTVEQIFNCHLMIE